MLIVNKESHSLTCHPHAHPCIHKWNESCLPLLSSHSRHCTLAGTGTYFTSCWLQEAELACGLVTYRGLNTVTHSSTDQARCIITSLMHPIPLLLWQITTSLTSDSPYAIDLCGLSIYGIRGLVREISTLPMLCKRLGWLYILHFYLHHVSKNVPPLSCYNFDTCERILIFFGRNATDKLSNQDILLCHFK